MKRIAAMMNCSFSLAVLSLLRMKVILLVKCFRQPMSLLCSQLSLLFIPAIHALIMKHYDEKMHIFGRMQQYPRLTLFSRTAHGMLLMHLLV
jgi:hypothetical protein